MYRGKRPLQAGYVASQIGNRQSKIVLKGVSLAIVGDLFTNLLALLDGRFGRAEKLLIQGLGQIAERLAGQIGKTGLGGEEAQRDLPRGPIAMLSYDNIGDVTLLGVRVVQLLPVDKDHHVRILLQGPTFA